LIMKPYEEGMYEGPYIVADLEVDGEYAGDARYGGKVVLAVWYCSWNGTFKYSYNLRKMYQDLKKAKTFVAHNAKYDLKHLIKNKAPVGHLNIYDTMLAQYTLDGIIRNKVGLDALCERYGLDRKEVIINTLMKNGVPPSEMPKSLLLDRCIRDVRTTKQLYDITKKQIKNRNIFPLLHVRLSLCKTLAYMEMKGMHLDKDRVYDEYVGRAKEFEQLQQELDEFTGGINHNSSKQKQEYLYDYLKFEEVKDCIKGGPLRTATGNRKADMDTIRQLKPKTKEQESYLKLIGRYAKLNAELSKALDKFKECVDSNELLYANFNQHISKTHRLTSSGTKHKIQFQNMQRDFKPLFSARKDDWLMMEADYSNLEFVVAGFLCNDIQIYEDFTHDVDVHKVSASEIFSVPIEEVTSEQRTTAKAFTFLPLFGGTSGTEDQKRYYRAFNERYRGVVDQQESWKASVINKKYFKIETGMEFRFPEARVNRRGYLNVNNNVCNYAIQHFSTGEIVPIAVSLLHDEMVSRGYKSFLVNTVHDSVVIEVNPKEKESLEELVVEVLTTKVYNFLYENYGIEFWMPLGVGIKTGNHWAEGQETKYKVNPPWEIAA